MQSRGNSRGCLRFTFLGVPTTIYPSSWLMLLILGSSVGGAQMDILPTLIFVVVGMFILLVHEYGHAFTGIALGGGSAVVEIASLGGMTYSSCPPGSRFRQLITVLAGCGATLLLAVLGGAVMALQLGVAPLKGAVYALCMPLSFAVSPELEAWCFQPIFEQLSGGGIGYFNYLCYHTLFVVSVWWSLYNLLPIMPMDGGKALLFLTNSIRFTAIVGLTLSVILFAVGLVQFNVFALLISAYFVWLNWRYIRLSKR